jgi:hypothetical protein
MIGRINCEDKVLYIFDKKGVKTGEIYLGIGDELIDYSETRIYVQTGERLCSYDEEGCEVKTILSPKNIIEKRKVEIKEIKAKEIEKEAENSANEAKRKAEEKRIEKKTKIKEVKKEKLQRLKNGVIGILTFGVISFISFAVACNYHDNKETIIIILFLLWSVTIISFIVYEIFRFFKK